MRTDILDHMRFYQSPLGLRVNTLLSERIKAAWPSVRHCRTGIFGYGWPYIDCLRDAERVILLAPEGMGAVAASPQVSGHVGAVLTDDLLWPLPDASLDRLIVVHGLEEAASPRQLLREIWRVLADDGSLLLITANRRSLWSMMEKTPFAAGRPWGRGQLDRFLRASLFVPTRWSRALFMPPTNAGFVVRTARTWERTGSMLWPPLSGVIMVEARKEMAVPISGSKVEKLSARILRPGTALPFQSQR